MSTWRQFAEEAPDLARRVGARFAANRHQVLATLRADGGPRLSGIELHFHAADAWLGSMPRSAKGRDLVRDPRFAVHSAPLEADLADGDATLEGTARPSGDLSVWRAITGNPDDSEQQQLTGELFRLEIERAALVRVESNRLVVESWRPGRAPRLVERD